MRKFDDASGATWVATVRERPGTDYKGRYFLSLRPEGGDEKDEEEGVALLDVRWNSRRTGERTLETMSDTELRRRLRLARGRYRARSAGESDPAAE